MTTRTRILPALVAFALALAGAFNASLALADPPTRVARLSNIAGTVTFSPAGDDEWVQAILNRPVITGDRVWSDNGGRVELTLDNGALWLGPMTSLVASNIDDRTTQLELQQGTLEFRVRRMTPGSTIEIDTPNLAFQVTGPGRYRLDVDPQSGSTMVEVRAGGGEVYGERASYALASGQGYRFYGTDLNDSEYFAPRGADEFDRYARERDARFDSVASARYVSPEVVGYEDLDRYGSWNNVSSYGNVWFPQEVPTDWAPYRNGHWSWIDPWGWTWVDEAPWGFAPFHYGRWAYVSNRWGWIPGPVNVRPVYAPALVAFVGGANWSVSVSSGPAIGWIPLGPREVYRPAYNVSRDYYRQVNVSNTVINNTVINNTYVSNVTNTTAPVTQQTNLVNLRAPNAVTAVSHAAFAQSQPVNRALVRVPNSAINTAQVQSTAAVAPARAAFVGAAPAAQARPSATVQQQAVVARSAPPPAPMPVAQQLKALERNPGKPLDRAEMQAKNGPAAAPARNVQVVNTAKPTTSAPPPAVQGDAMRARSGPPPRPAPANAQSPTPQAQPAQQPSRPPEQRATPPEPARGAPQTQPPQAQPVPPQPQARPAEPKAMPSEPPRPAPQVQPAPPVRPPEQRATPQEQPRPAPQTQPPQAQPQAQPQPQARQPEPPRPAPQAQPQARPPEQRATPPEPPRPTPQAQPPQPRPPEQRATPPEPPRPAPQAQPQARPPEPPRPAPQALPPQPRPPEQRATPPEPPRPPPAQPAQPRPPEQRPAPAPQPPVQRPPEAAPPGAMQRGAPQQPQPAPRPDDKAKGKDKDKDKDKDKQG